MKITFQTITLPAAALSLASGAMLATPASAKTRHHAQRHHMTRRHTAMHRSATGSTRAMHSAVMDKGSMNGSAAAAPRQHGMANPAMFTAPATSGGDKP